MLQRFSAEGSSTPTSRWQQSLFTTLPVAHTATTVHWAPLVQKSAFLTGKHNYSELLRSQKNTELQMIPRETTWKLASVTILFLGHFRQNTVRNFVVKEAPRFSFLSVCCQPAALGLGERKVDLCGIFYGANCFYLSWKKTLYGIWRFFLLTA